MTFKFFDKIRYKNYIFLFILILIIFYRSPYIFLEGRFFAEEGTIWFRNIFINGKLDTLFFIYEISGYIHLWMNIAAFFSGLVDIEYAPLVTSYFAFFLLLYIFIYILKSDSILLTNKNFKYIGCLIILFSPVMTAEVWMNSLNAMSYFGIFAFLVLFEKKETKFRYINYLVFVISGLSGYYASALAPLYLIKYYYKKTFTNLTYLLILILTSSIQFLTTVYSVSTNEIASERFLITYEKIISFIYNVILKSLFGREILQKILALFNHGFLSIAAIIFTIISLIILIMIALRKKDYVLNLVIFSFLIQSLLIIFGSAYDNFVGGRYSVCVGVIFLFIFLRLYNLYRDTFMKYFYGLIILIFLFVGFLDYKITNPYPDFLSCIECPNWKNEVNQWKLNKKYNLKIWPYPMTTVKLY